VTRDNGKLYATSIKAFFAFVVIFHVLGAVLYLSFFDLLSSRLSFAVMPPSAVRLHLGLLFLSIPTAVLIYVLESRKRRLLLGPVFRVFFAAFVILLLAVVLLTILIPAAIAKT
jgi:hypothetical protein